MSESPKTMKEYVEFKVQQIKNDYINNYERVISDYEKEVRERKSYHGRELLELLQNADDEMEGEKEPRARIEFDGERLIVSNNGRPFSKKGLSSLMLSNLSPKREKKNVIGNKGTGFRSILSWATEIEIDSGDLHVKFSPKHSANMLKELYPNGYPEKMTAPTLAFPEWKKTISTSGFTTTIVIKVKNDERVRTDITKQIHKLNGELLLFLNNLIELEVVSNKYNFTFRKEKEKDNVYLHSVDSNGIHEISKWLLYRSDDNVFNNKTYSVVLAYNLDGKMPENNVLHAYFPTKIEFPFPVILHADFDIDGSRNHLNENDENSAIFARAARMMVDLALKLFGDKVSYKPLEFLIPRRDLSTDLTDYGFDISLDEAIKDSCVFPTVNNEYVRYSDELKFYTSEFPKYVYGDGFADLLQYCDSESVVEYLLELINNQYDWNDDYGLFVEAVNNWISLLPENEESLISIVHCLSSMLEDDDIKYFFASYRLNNEEQFNLFFDINYNSLSIFEQKFITGKNTDIKDLPSFIKTKTLHPVMEQAILQSEPILRKLDTFNIFEYTFKDIVESANSVINDVDDNETKRQYCIELLQWIYVYSEHMKKEENVSIYLPNRNNEFLLSSKMFMGEEYGNKVGEIIIQYIEPGNFVFDIRDVLGIDRKESVLLLEHLGVSKFPRIRTNYVSCSVRYGTMNKEYARKIIDSLEYPVAHKEGRFNSPKEFFAQIKDLNVYVEQIYDLEVILSNAKTKDILAWIKADTRLRAILYNQFDLKTKVLNVRWDEMNKDRQINGSIVSYIWWLFQSVPWIEVDGKRYRIRDCLLANNSSVDLTPHLVFPNVGEYVSELSGKIKNHKNEYSTILLKLGMKKDFSDLDVHKIYEVLLAISDISDSQMVAKRFYESILEDRNTRERLLAEIEDKSVKEYSDFLKKGKVMCRNGAYSNLRDSCYMVRRDVCESILETINVMDVSGRIGFGDITKLFGVKELKIQGLKMDDYIVHPSSSDFTKDFNRYKALAFTYRVNSKDDAKSQARLFSGLKITLCSKIELLYKGNKYSLNEGEFYNSGNNQFYLCYPPYSKNNRDTKLGIGVANIICSHLNVYEIKAELRELFSAGTNDDRLTILHDSFDDDTILKARKMINSDEDLRDDFIEIIDQLSDVDISSCTQMIDEIDFDDITSIYNSSKIIKLFKKINIDVDEFNSKVEYELDLIPYFKKQIENLIPQYRDYYENSCFNKLKDSTIESKSELQKMFLDYEYLCSDIKIRNSVNFDPNKEIINQLSINERITLLDLKTLYVENKKKFLSFIDDVTYVNDFLSIPANASLVYYQENDVLKKRYSEYLLHSKDKEAQDKETSNTSTKKAVLVDIASVSFNPSHSNLNAQNRKSSPKKTGFKDRSQNTTKNGRDGEKIVFDMLFADPLKKYVRWSSENGQITDENPEGSSAEGYDMEYTNELGTRCYVEVKSTTDSIEKGVSFFLTNNEYKFAMNHSSSYYVYYVSEVNSDTPKITILSDLFIDEDKNVNRYRFDVENYYIERLI